jgi:glycosyltransferase involved in cell wall biosynthesis
VLSILSKELSIIVPAYNEEKNIYSFLMRLTEILDSSLDYEIIVVNDGSKDKTLDILKEGSLHPCIRVISYLHNAGKGHAIRVGVLQSRGNIVMFLDGDGDINVSGELIMNCIEKLKKDSYSLLIGSKAHPLSIIHVPVSRKILSKIFNSSVRIFGNIKKRDTQTGFKAGNGNIMRAIFKFVKTSGYAFDVEFMIIATKLNLNIEEIPVIISHNNKLKVREVMQIFFEVIAILFSANIKNQELQRGLELELTNIDNSRDAKNKACR